MCICLFPCCGMHTALCEPICECGSKLVCISMQESTGSESVWSVAQGLWAYWWPDHSFYHLPLFMLFTWCTGQAWISLSDRAECYCCSCWCLLQWCLSLSGKGRGESVVFVFSKHCSGKNGSHNKIEVTVVSLRDVPVFGNSPRLQQEISSAPIIPLLFHIASVYVISSTPVIIWTTSVVTSFCASRFLGGGGGRFSWLPHFKGFLLTSQRSDLAINAPSPRHSQTTEETSACSML